MIGTGYDLNNRINSQIIICLFDARFYLHYALLFTLLFRPGFTTNGNRDMCMDQITLNDKLSVSSS